MLAGAASSPAVRTLAWQGRAHVEASGRALDLMVDTRVEPFRRARSRSWIVGQAEATARTLVIEPADGWMEKHGARVALPPALVAHERQQYGLYGYLLQALEGRGRGATRLGRPGFPEARFTFDGDWPNAADYTVSAPETGAPPIAQHVTFAEPLDGARVRWPRRITISQGGRPYFDLTIDRFEAQA